MKGFVSYAHEDGEMFKEVRKYLTHLERVFEIEFWSDHSIRAGQHWNTEIRDAINAADVFLLLCSPSFLASDFIFDEAVAAIEGRARKDQIIPVILQGRRWRDHFGAYQAVPTDQNDVKPIVNWVPQSEGYEQAFEQVKVALAKLPGIKTKPPRGANALILAPQAPAGKSWYKQHGRFVSQLDSGPPDEAAAADGVVRTLLSALVERAEQFATESTDFDQDELTQAAVQLGISIRAVLDGAVPKIVLAFSAVVTLGSFRTQFRRWRDTGRNSEAPDAGREHRLDNLVNQAMLALMQFPTIRDKQPLPNDARDLAYLTCFARPIMEAAHRIGLIDDADWKGVEAEFEDANRENDGQSDNAPRAVLTARNFLYRLGGVAAGFVPGATIAGDAADAPLAAKMTRLLREETNALESFAARLPDHYRDAFRQVMNVAATTGLTVQAPPRPTEPPADFDMKKVRELVLAGRTVPDAWVPFVTSLDFFITGLNDLKPLSALAALQSLSLSSAPLVNDLTPLSALYALQAIYLSNTQVSDLTPLSALSALETIYLNNTQVSDLTPLSALSALQTIRLNNTQVSDLTPLGVLSALQTIDLDNTQVRDLTPLSALSALQTIHLDGTQVTDLTPLSVLSALQIISLNSTQVSDLTPLSALSALEAIDLSHTRVSDLTPLRALADLQHLFVTGSKVTNTNVLAHLSNLRITRRPDDPPQ